MTDCTISLCAVGFALTIPSDSSGRTHTIEVPQSVGGLKIIHRVLMDRQRAADRRIGHVASPTQVMVEQWLRIEAENHRKMLEEDRKKKLLPDLDIDLSSIDLDL